MSVKKCLALGLVLGAGAVCVLIASGALNDVLAQTGPLGIPRPQAPAAQPPDGFTGWLLAKQAEYYRAMSGAIRGAKTDNAALWALFGLAFAYGIFHAAGPGHGKAVISSYLVANEETWRRGIVLSFASAFLQALVAVLIVGIAAALLGATAKMMGEAVRYIEIVSYALIAALGARLLWVKGKGFIAALRGVEGEHDRHAHDHAHHRAHDHHAHAHAHSHGADHVHDAHCGHSHGPEPDQLAGPGGWKRGLTAIVAVGLRPCSGAILILVYTLAQGLFLAGIAATFIMGLGTAITVAVLATLAVNAQGLARRFAATRAGKGELIMRGIEVAAAVLVLVFGLALLAGYMVSERMFA
ncbi:MAG: nickel/cobalt transporter [Pseudorhodoplanes sp.]|nr:nickel/cobalt transporter [Pseudorhodoplanes sp.]